ncbi:MAG: LytR/AlgR family response regulator transcription factor, partial [Gemmatimonadota bacterium]
AVDYLLKPFSDERFREAVERAKRRLRERRADALAERLFRLVDGVRRDRAPPIAPGGGATSVPRPFVVKSAGRVHFVAPDEIRWVEAAGDYVRLHTAERTHLLRETMRRAEARLRPSGFVRIHRSSLVRLEAIEELQVRGDGECEVILEDGERLRVSRSGRRRLERKVGGRV